MNPTLQMLQRRVWLARVTGQASFALEVGGGTTGGAGKKHEKKILKISKFYFHKNQCLSKRKVSSSALVKFWSAGMLVLAELSILNWDIGLYFKLMPLAA